MATLPTDRVRALNLLHETARRGEYATGVLYVEPDKQDFLELLGRSFAGDPDSEASADTQIREQPSAKLTDVVL